MNTTEITIHFTLDNIQQAARRFIEAMGGSTVFAFYGGMGAGKTTFIRTLCEQLGVTDTVTSPTFAIVNEYAIDPSSVILEGSSVAKAPSASFVTHPSSFSKVFHFDFYRLRRIEEAADIGFEDYLYSGNICLIEWPEMVEPLLPEDAVSIRLTANADGSRTLVCSDPAAV